MSIVEFKVGTSFDVPITYTPDPDLAPATLENTTITSQIRNAKSDLICNLTATKADDFMSFNLSADAGTHDWPFDITVKWDIKFVDTVFGEFYSDTTELRLVRPQTR